MPRRARTRHSPVTTSDLPASEEVPAIKTPLAGVALLLTGAVYGVSADRSDACRIGAICVWLGAAVIKS
jgi:hypothetical protein